MKYLILYAVMVYIVACADDTGDDATKELRIYRAVAWPITVTNFFRSQSIKLHRMLNILWCVLIAGWFLSLLSDRL